MSLTQAPRRRPTLPTVAGLCVALLMTFVGAVGLIQATEEFMDWFESGKLAQAEALIRTAEITEESLELGQRYEVIAAYDVSWNGTLSQAHRVTKHRSQTFDKAAAEARLKVLLDAKADGHPLVCYLSPTEPEQAVLFLDFPYAAIGIALVLGAGLAPSGIWLGLRVWGIQKRSWQIAALQYRFPQQPWIREPSRFEGRCPVQRRWPLIIAACLGWNIPTCGLSLLMQLGLGTQQPLVTMITPPALLVGVSLFVITLCAFWQLGKYGEPQLVVRPWPLMLGDRLDCTLRFTEKLSFKGPLTVQLEVPPEMAAAEGFQAASIEPISVVAENDDVHWEIPSPWRVEQTSAFNPDDFHIANWKLHITDRSRLLGFHQTYDVLVYHCPQPTSEDNQAAHEATDAEG